MKSLLRALAVAASLVVVIPASAQQRETRMLITVIDQTNAIIPDATVTVTGTEPATQKLEPAPVKTASNGQAAIGGLTPGRYTARAEFQGFYPGVLKEVRIRPGDNRHIIVLLVENFQETVEVKQDAQAGAADRRSDAFGSVLTREQMDALSDDPDEMQRQLMDMAGPGAVMRIDSFEGGRLPPKSQIKSIRVTRDQFAAENHSADSFFVEVITQPGIGPIRTGFNYGLRNSAMSARNAFHTTKGEEQDQYYGLNIGGGLIQNKASFFLRVFGSSAYDTPNSSIARSTGTRIETLKQRVPRENMFVNGNFDWAVTRDQTLRFSYNRNSFVNKNQGIGGYDEPERAFLLKNYTNTFRAQEVGPLGRRFFINTRLNVGWSDSERESSVEEPTVRIIDAQTFGGAQKAGGRHSRDVNFASDLDYVRGIHSVRVGAAIDVNWYRSDESDNYLGTYTFENVAAFVAERPRSYTRRVGVPEVHYSNVQTALYVQDDIRIRKSLSVTPGVRLERQAHIHGLTVGPRLGATWAPFANGKTTLRASWGIFYDWLQTNTYEQTIRIDGSQQREINIANPAYPVPPLDPDGTAPADRYLLGSASRAPEKLPRQWGRRLRVLSAVSGERDVSLCARRRIIPRPQPERAGERDSEELEIRQRRRGRWRRLAATACVERRRSDEFPAGIGEDGAQVGLQALQFLRQLLSGVERKQHRRSVQRAGHGRSRPGVGECGPTCQASLQRRVPDPGIQRSVSAGERQRQSRHGLRYSDGFRQQQ